MGSLHLYAAGFTLALGKLPCPIQGRVHTCKALVGLGLKYLRNHLASMIHVPHSAKEAPVCVPQLKNFSWHVQKNSLLVGISCTLTNFQVSPAFQVHETKLWWIPASVSFPIPDDHLIATLSPMILILDCDLHYPTHSLRSMDKDEIICIFKWLSFVGTEFRIKWNQSRRKC